MVTYLQAQLEDLLIHFELNQAQMYGDASQMVPIHWEESGQVFIGEIELKDLELLDWAEG